MKPIVIIAISIVCSVVAVLGILAGFVGVSNIEAEKQNKNLQKYYADLDLAESYRVEYDKIAWNLCMKSPPPSTYDEAEIQLSKSKQLLEYSIQVQPRVFTLEQNMDFLQEKYPDNDYFKFEETTCPYEKEWERSFEALRDYQRGLTGELTVEETDKVEAFVSKQYEKCIEENNAKFICNAKLGEFTESAKLIYGYN